MSSKHSETTNLWSLAWSLQEKLEGQGLDDDVVDAAVTRGLVALVAGRKPAPKQRPITVTFSAVPTLGKA